MRGTPYGSTPLCALSFCISHPARRFALQHAAQYGHVHALHIQREFADYNRTAARDLLHVMRDRGVLLAGEVVLDVQGKRKQLTYTLSDMAREGLEDLRAYTAQVLALIEVTHEAHE